MTFNWQMSRERPVERCLECGSVYKMEYVGPPDDPHAHGHDDRKYTALELSREECMANLGRNVDAHGYEEPKTFADYVRPEYRGTPQPHYGRS